MSEVLVRGGRVLVGRELVERDLGIRDGVVVDAVGPEADVVDAAGLLVAPGFVDLQCNGGLGIDLASEPERLWELAAFLPRWGVTAWLPTIVTTPDGILERALDSLRAGPPAGWTGAVPLGLHLEGPFVSPERRGAHPAALLQAPSSERAAGWSRDAGVAMVTLAPELDGGLELVRELSKRGVIVSIGHSAATEAQARAAVDAGARWVTHLYNAMSPLHHREPGVVGVALTDERLHVGLIVDGIHVQPTAVALAQRLLGERLTLVTDAVAALGLVVGGDGVRLPDGTLAGSDLSMDQAVRNLCAFTACAPDAALGAAATAPAALLEDEERGNLRPGSRADVVLLTPALEVVATVVRGRPVHGTLATP